MGGYAFMYASGMVTAQLLQGLTGGGVPSRGGSVSAMVLAMVIDAVIVLAAAGLTLLLPRRAAGRRAAGRRAAGRRAAGRRAAEAEEPIAEYASEAVH